MLLERTFSSYSKVLAVAFVLVNFLHAEEPEESKPRSWAAAIHHTQARPLTDGADTAKKFKEGYPIAADWLMQDYGSTWEDRFNRQHTGKSDQQLARKAIDDIEKLGGDADGLKKRLADANEDPLQTYFEACESRRALRLETLIEKHAPIAFAQHHPFKMSFIGYTEGLSDARDERFFKPGGKLSLLHFEGLYTKKQELLHDPHGMIRDAEVSFDEERLYFAWKKSDRLDDYHLYEYNLKTKDVQQLTFGLGRADYEPLALPDGDLIFASTRPEQSVPCFWTEISNLYRMDNQGRYIRRLAVDQVHTIYPTLLPSGRLVYTRWDYNDRGQVFPHPVFSMNPDGTGQRVYYGGNSWFPCSLLHTRAIPGTNKAMAVIAGHHTTQRGKLVVLDVSQGRDEGVGMEFVAPRSEVPYERVDRAQQEGDQFRYPYPINENEFLVVYTPLDVTALKPNYGDDATYGLYWMNLDGHRELLHLDPKLPLGRPVPVSNRELPKTLPDTVDYKKDTGTYYVRNVYDGLGLKGVAKGSAKKIRVVELDYRAAGVGKTGNMGFGHYSINSSPVAIGNGSWDVKRILGDADIHEDGSARFEIPAMASTYLQVLDSEGKAIQTTRSWDTVRPGEQKACMGCHVKQDANFLDYRQEETMAWRQAPQKLQPFYGEARGFSFIHEIQPILDKKCVSCHDGSNDLISLKGDMPQHGNIGKRRWSTSYLNLTNAKQVRSHGKRLPGIFFQGDPNNEMVNWISKMSAPTELEPYSAGAKTSLLSTLLEAGHHGVELTQKERHKFYAWLDLLVPFIGSYREGHDWTEAEINYYDYYEHKRHLHKEEEVNYIQEWLTANKHPQEGTNQIVLGSIPRDITNKTGGYRSLLSANHSGPGTQYTVPFNHPVLIDRLKINCGEQKIQLITDASHKQSLTIPENGYLHLKKPLRLTKLTLISKGAPIKSVESWGVSASELPQDEGYHPYFSQPTKQKSR